MPGPRCAGSSPHLSPCREETTCQGSFFHSLLLQSPPCSPSPVLPPICASTSLEILSAGGPALLGAAAARPADVPDQLHGLLWVQQQHSLPLAQLGQALTNGGDQKKLVLPKVPIAAPRRAISQKPPPASTYVPCQVSWAGLQPHLCPITPSPSQKEQVPHRRREEGEENEASSTFAKRFTLTTHSLYWHSRFQV